MPPMVAVLISGIPLNAAIIANTVKHNIARKIWGLTFPNGTSFPFGGTVDGGSLVVLGRDAMEYCVYVLLSLSDLTIHISHNSFSYYGFAFSIAGSGNISSTLLVTVQLAPSTVLSI